MQAMQMVVCVCAWLVSTDNMMLIYVFIGVSPIRQPSRMKSKSLSQIRCRLCGNAKFPMSDFLCHINCLPFKIICMHSPTIKRLLNRY